MEFADQGATGIDFVRSPLLRCLSLHRTILIMTSHDTLFVWRETYGWRGGGGEFWGNPHPYYDYSQRTSGVCPFCLTKLRHRLGDVATWYFDALNSCPLCGFWTKRRTYAGDWMDDTIGILHEFDISSSKVAFEEIGEVAKKNPELLTRLKPRRFEEFIEDVYRNNGWQTSLTQQTRDGGYDLLMFEKHSEQPVLVECKQSPSGHPVAVRVVREVLGVQVIEGATHAKIVAVPGFSRDATLAAVEVNNKQSMYSMELVDTEAILRLLNVYNTKLPTMPLALDILRAQHPQS